MLEEVLAPSNTPAPLSMPTHTYHHRDEDNNVDYTLTLLNVHTTRPVLRWGITTDPDAIFRNRDNRPILKAVGDEDNLRYVSNVPSSIQFELGFTQMMSIYSLFVESVSFYMQNVRKKIYLSNTLSREFDFDNLPYIVKFTAVKKQVKKSGKSSNSARLLLVFVDKETGEDRLCVSLKRTKIVLLMDIIKSLFETYVRKFTAPIYDADDTKLLIARVDDNIAVGNVWLHGREVQKFQDYIERVLFDFKYRVGDGRELFNYRQVAARFSEIQDVPKIILTKFGQNQRVWKDEEGNKSVNEFLITSETAAAFYLFLPKAIEFNVGDVEVFLENGRGVESDELDDIEMTEDAGYRYVRDNMLISKIDSGDFILNTIEAQIVLTVDKTKKFNAKKREGCITMAARYRDSVIADDNYKVGRYDSELGEYVQVEKLAKVNLDLKIDWLYIFALCAESVHHGDQMEMNEFGNLIRSWRYTHSNVMGSDQYRVRIVSDNENKVPAVMLIDFFADDFNEYTNAPLPGTGGKRMRIPLFKEHIRTLIKGLLSLSAHFEEYYWMKAFDAYSDDLDKVEGRLSLGIKRYLNPKGEEIVSFGVIQRRSQLIDLSDADRDTLFFSAYHRLMYGRWLQFSGEQVSIGFDGWLTDRFDEYNLELDLENSNGSSGSLSALAIAFCCARPKTLMKALDEMDGMDE